MSMYVALLRGINLGSRNKIAMPALKQLFQGLGQTEVSTYIQSGNVVFAPAPGGCGVAELRRCIEKRITEQFGLDIVVLLRSADELAQVVAGNPYQGRDGVHATFLGEQPSGQLQRPPGESAECTLGVGVVYLYCPDGYGRTKLNNAFIERRLGTAATTRNWRTVTTLLGLAQPAGRS